MDHQNPEKLSALVDGELSDTELEQAAGQLSGDQTLHATWQRYHLIGDILRDDVADGLHGLQVAARVREALADEPVVLAPRRRKSTAWKPVAGFAIAATVAAVAVITVQPGQVDAPAGPAVAETAPPVPNPTVFPGVQDPAVELVADNQGLAAENDGATLDAPANQRLNSYLMNFNEQRASIDSPVGHPHVRTVRYDANR